MEVPLTLVPPAVNESTGENGKNSDVKSLPARATNPKTRRNKKRKPRIDLETSIPPGLYKNQLQNTRDILGKFELAPPTKRAMHLANYQNVGKFFANPGRRIPSVTLSQQFYRALALRTEIQREHTIIGDGLLSPLDSELRLGNSECTTYVEDRFTECSSFHIEKKKMETFDKLALGGMCRSRYITHRRSRRVSQFLKTKQKELEDPVTPDQVPVIHDEVKPSISPPPRIEKSDSYSIPNEHVAVPVPEGMKIDSPQDLVETKVEPKLENSPQYVDESGEDYMGDLTLKSSPQRNNVDYLGEVDTKGSSHPPDDLSSEDYTLAETEETQEPLFVVMDHSYLPTTEDAQKTDPCYNNFVVSPEGVLQLVEYADDIPSEAQAYDESGGEILEYQVVEGHHLGETYQGIPEDDPSHSVTATSTHHHLQECHEEEIMESRELGETYGFNNLGAEYEHPAEDYELGDQEQEDDQHQGLSYYPSNGCSGDMTLVGSQLTLVGECTMSSPGNENHPVYILCLEQPVQLNN